MNATLFQPDDLPAGLPGEVKQLLGRIKPEPLALRNQRKALLLQLESQRLAATGALREVLSTLHAVLQAMASHLGAQVESQQGFDRALKRYAKESIPARPLPPVVLECMGYLRDRVEAMGLGEVLERVSGAAPRTP
ncbi:hypothetical protein [Stigmatella erecta]|uniref:Uncharacterized protein n=1 Tax=Stigmatella erecta TaxID=83460 RepID=A0A1I0KME0_9BACT|nr:hypothetical protein [Stigmatella erecta]SEU26506.1 hypothetical protein SAMN05443639_112107 [Stigmatella erecta]